ncbi:MAG: hypothetical protein AAFW89_03700 [Bacteroidota bacterium]
MSLVIQIIRQIGKKWYLWIFLPLIAACIVFYVTGKDTKQFVSESSLYLNLPTNKGLSITNEGFKQHEISAYIQDLIHHTKSNKSMEFVKLSILQGYLRKENTLLNAPADAFPWTDSLAVVERIDTLFADHTMLDVRNELDATITIFLRDQGLTNDSIRDLFNLYREGSSNYLRLKVTTGDPFVSSYVGEKVIDAMLRLNKEINRGKLEADTKLFEKLVAQAKKELDKKVADLERYKIRNNVINLPEHTKAIVNQMVQLEVQKAELIEKLASKQEGILQIETKLDVKDEIPVDLSKNERFIELQQRMRQLDQQTPSELRKDVTLRQIEATSLELGNLVQEYVGDVPIDIRRARQELIQQYLNYQVELEMTKQLIPLVEAEIDRISAYARTFAPLESNIGTLEREITTAQETFLILVNKLNLAKTVAQGTGVNELVVIDSPDVPLLPVPSKRKILIVLAALLVFIIVIVLIAAIEYLDAGIWSARDFKQMFNIEPYATLPELLSAEETSDEKLTHYLNVLHVQQVKSVAIQVHNYAEFNEKEVVLLSSMAGEGKHRMATRLHTEMDRLGYNTSVRCVDDFEESEELIALDEESTSPKLNITILPPAALITCWKKWLKPEKIFIWMYHSGRAPINCDSYVLDRISEHDSITILNNVQLDYLEDSGVEVQRNRSLLRIWTKRMLNLQFKTKTLEVAR